MLFAESLQKLNRLLCYSSHKEIMKQILFIAELIRKSLNYEFYVFARDSIKDSLSLFFNIYHIPYNAEETRIYTDLDDCTGYLQSLFRYYVENRPEEDLFSYEVILALSYINSNYEKEITLKSLADHLNINISYLSSEFNKQIHCSLSEYITKIRLEKSIPYLQKTEMTISDIATVLGFSSSHYFSSVFKKHYQLSPSQYRDPKRRSV